MPVASTTLTTAPSNGAPVAATPVSRGAVEPLGDSVVVVVDAIEVAVELLVVAAPAASAAEPPPPPHPLRKIRPAARRTDFILR